MKKTLGNISDQHRAEQKWQKEADGPLPAEKRRMYGRLYGIILLLALAIARRFCLKNSGASMSLPSEAVRNVLRPKSKPTLLPVLAMTVFSVASHTKYK